MLIKIPPGGLLGAKDLVALHVLVATEIRYNFVAEPWGQVVACSSEFSDSGIIGVSLGTRATKKLKIPIKHPWRVFLVKTVTRERIRSYKDFIAKTLKLPILINFIDMKLPVLGLKQKIYYQRLLVESKVKECDHQESMNWCMICKSKTK